MASNPELQRKAGPFLRSLAEEFGVSHPLVGAWNDAIGRFGEIKTADRFHIHSLLPSNSGKGPIEFAVYRREDGLHYLVKHTKTDWIEVIPQKGKFKVQSTGRPSQKLKEIESALGAPPFRALADLSSRRIIFEKPAPAPAEEAAPQKAADNFERKYSNAISEIAKGMSKVYSHTDFQLHGGYKIKGFWNKPKNHIQVKITRNDGVVKVEALHPELNNWLEFHSTEAGFKLNWRKMGRDQLTNPQYQGKVGKIEQFLLKPEFMKLKKLMGER